MYTTLVWVLVGCALIGAGASLVGNFAFLRKRSLVGDAVAHALLPGVVLSFILFQQKSLWVLFPGALIAGWLGLLSIEGITRHSKLKADTAIAIVLSVFFAIGIVLLTYVQQSAAGNQSGLDAFLFGKAAAMMPGDLYLFMSVDSLLMLVVWLCYPYFKLYTFDPEFAQAIGLPTRLIGFVLSTLTVMAVASGIQAVGVVLMAALIITPAAAGRFLSKRLSTMIFVSLAIGVTSAVGGVLISYTAPSMPTGPWIVIVLSAVAISIFVLAPERGMLSRWNTRRKHHMKMGDENVLKLLYQFSEHSEAREFPVSAITAARQFEAIALERSIARLLSHGLIGKNESGLYLSESGLTEAQRVVRLHRLWELYLNTRMNMASDHVHHNAEAIEHIITPELEAALIKELGYPTLDPHLSEIPGIPKTQHS
jgi:manganese/zinc/iron transport system permease protein